MSAFVRLEKPPPMELFAATIKWQRPSLESSFYAAFAAARARNDAMKVKQFALLNGTPDPQEVKNLHIKAYTEDIRADQQAAIVLLAADDALQRLGRAMLGSPPGVKRGFGHISNGASLTPLLRATTNCYRHVSEWDDNAELRFPYENSDTSDQNVRRALGSITVLQAELGIGRNERIWTAPTFYVLARIDGKFGTDPVDYGRFEDAVIQAGREIVATGDPSLLPRFDHELSIAPSASGTPKLHRNSASL